MEKIVSSKRMLRGLGVVFRKIFQHRKACIKIYWMKHYAEVSRYNRWNMKYVGYVAFVAKEKLKNLKVSLHRWNIKVLD